jgi:hypothetical protein
MSQEDLDQVLSHKVPISKFVQVDRGPTDVLLSIRQGWYPNHRLKSFHATSLRQEIR